MNDTPIDWSERLIQYHRHTRVDGALQVAIAVLSIAAAYMVADTGPMQRWGYVVGLLSQPFWCAAAWRAQQPGILIVAIFYTGAWLIGIANRFQIFTF